MKATMELAALSMASELLEQRCQTAKLTHANESPQKVAR